LQEKGCSELKLQATEVEVSGVAPDYLIRRRESSAYFINKQASSRELETDIEEFGQVSLE